MEKGREIKGKAEPFQGGMELLHIQNFKWGDVKPGEVDFQPLLISWGREMEGIESR